MRLAFSPIDTWFFRDGTPFDMGASPQAGVLGVFPPSPRTVAGAIRAVVALQNGWDGRARWSREIELILGDGPENLGQLRIKGPFVLKEGSPVFPMPRHILGCLDSDDRWQPISVLRPCGKAVSSDLGPGALFPDLVGGAGDATLLVPGAGRWVTLCGLERILRGQLPLSEHLLDERDIWAAELHVGIARESSTHTVAEGSLFSTRHVRLRPGVSICVEVDGIPSEWRSPVGCVLPFGGESRLAACELAGAAADIKFEQPIDDTGDAAVLIALTPLLLNRDELSGRVAFSAGGVRIVSACVDRPLRIGGWDSLRRTPVRLNNAVAPGSTLFCLIEHPDKFRQAIKGGLLRVGAATTPGFGLCAVGNAPVWS